MSGVRSEEVGDGGITVSAWSAVEASRLSWTVLTDLGEMMAEIWLLGLCPPLLDIGGWPDYP